MSIVIITGSNGLVGSEATHFFCKKGFEVIGIDNNLRKFFFGKDGSTIWIKNILKKNKRYYIVQLNLLMTMQKIFPS